jgi:subtilisin family serine protease
VFEGAGCEVLNLSLGSPPLVPIEGFDPENPPAVPAPYVPASASEVAVLEAFVSATGSFAVDNGTLPVASAGNSAVNLDEPVEVPDVGNVAPVVLPAEAEGFMSVGAAGPIGFGWPLEPRSEEVAPGLEIEAPIRTELPTEEPANYTNYGADGVDVTAGGGNFDVDAFAAGVTEARYDLVFNTGIANLLPTDPDGDGEIENPEDLVLDEYVPGYVFKAGTSFAAPNVAGLAALLFAAGEEPTPGEVRAAIEDTAEPLPVGRAAETTAPVLPTDQVTLDTDNEATDGDFDGDKPSSPGRTPGRFDPATFRGEGHIDVAAAVRRISASEDDDGPPGRGD